VRVLWVYFSVKDQFFLNYRKNYVDSVTKPEKVG